MKKTKTNYVLIYCRGYEELEKLLNSWAKKGYKAFHIGTETGLIACIFEKVGD